MFDEEPDRDPHGECRAEIARLAAELAAARAVPADVEARAWCVECDVDILSDGNSGERCDWLVFIYGEEDAREARDRAIDRLVDEGHAADAEAAERMVRIVPLVPFRRAIAEARQPSTVGGLLATARCSCTHEAGDSRCDAHPSCSECGAASARPVDGCEACRGTLSKGG